MPGPFPGMDPYLEASGVWESVHHTFIVYAAAALNLVLPPQYVAIVEEWLIVLPPRRRIQPDVALSEAPAAPSLSGVAVVERPMLASDAPVIVEALREDAPHQLYVNIVRVKDESEIITTLELLSHANKSPGKDRQAYRRKQAAVYASATHLIEIDLLRLGAHTVAVPLERLDAARYDYLACLHRGNTGPRFELWPVTVQQRLPRIRVPLEEEVPDAVLDLQAVLDRSYDEGAYARQIDYTGGAVPPLAAEDLRWADALLREKGLRG
jgi:hypothetical protein